MVHSGTHRLLLHLFLLLAPHLGAQQPCKPETCTFPWTSLPTSRLWLCPHHSSALSLCPLPPLDLMPSPPLAPGPWAQSPSSSPSFQPLSWFFRDVAPCLPAYVVSKEKFAIILIFVPLYIMSPSSGCFYVFLFITGFKLLNDDTPASVWFSSWTCILLSFLDL